MTAARKKLVIAIAVGVAVGLFLVAMMNKPTTTTGAAT